MNFGRQIKTGGVQGRRPEKRVEVGNVFTDEVMNLRFRIVPPIFNLLAVLLAPFAGRPDITDRGVVPDVPIIAGEVGNFKTEIRRGPGNIPWPELVGEELRFGIVREFRLKRAEIIHPILQEIARFFEFNK